MSERFFVLTGGPGSGKTSTLDELSRRGIATMLEAGRGVIREQIACGGDALPWADRERFAASMLEWDLRNHDDAAHHPGPVIFDRGIPDIAGYLALCNLPLPQGLRDAANRHRYNGKVFAFPFWPEIFANDAERKQTAREAQMTFEYVSDAYSACGYELVVVPRLSISRRADFIMSRIAVRQDI